MEVTSGVGPRAPKPLVPAGRVKPRSEPVAELRGGGAGPTFALYGPNDLLTHSTVPMPCGRKRKRHKIATHKRKKRLRKNRHKKKGR